jgi:DNA-binding NarL/FixJ family response regulator
MSVEIVVITTNPLLLRELQGEVITATVRHPIVLLATVAELKARLSTHRPALVLVDARTMVSGAASETLHEVLQQWPKLKVLMLKHSLVASYIHVLSAVSIDHALPASHTSGSKKLATAIDEADLAQYVLKLLAEKRIADRKYLLDKDVPASAALAGTGENYPSSSTRPGDA